MKNKIVGILLLPLLYIRWSFLLIMPICIYIKTIDNTATVGDLIGLGFLGWIIWGIFFGFIFGNCEAMIPITKWLHKVFKVEYLDKGSWESNMVHSHSMWIHPIIEIKGKEYKFSFASMGGNTYDSEANLRRSILFTWLLK